QPSDRYPQSLPEHALGVQVPAPQTLATPGLAAPPSASAAVVPPPQVRPVVQLPQLRMPPQPSGIWPQFLPTPPQLRRVQPQTFFLPPPPPAPSVPHDPQSSTPAQPPETRPQFLFSAAHVVRAPG